jgi:hypothetical protein
MKILQKEVTWTQTSFSTNFVGGKLSFLFAERLHYLYNYNYSWTLCIKC